MSNVVLRYALSLICLLLPALSVQAEAGEPMHVQLCATHAADAQASGTRTAATARVPAEAAGDLAQLSHGRCAGGAELACCQGGMSPLPSSVDAGFVPALAHLAPTFDVQPWMGRPVAPEPRPPRG